ncbi:MAG TPA: phospholipase D family protein [Acidiferrobacterales bacterium]|nr:phospholipase D family protein [Acidiferrobacterales bacterium]
MPVQIGRRPVKRSARFVPFILVVCFVAGCATQEVWQKPAPDFAQAPRPEGLFAELEQRIAAAHGNERSGFNLLERNDRALLWRLASIDSARHSIDLQYYVWFGDTLGKLMMFRVIDAADRGVKVRILFDDLNTMLHDMTHVELRDVLLARVDRHPNIEIRVFNAWQDRSLFGRAVGMAADFKRLNRRMHNKQLIVDNRVAIIGGRNLGDEYFGLNPDFNFHDLDVLGVGPVARQASQVFDRYWNSDWVRSIPKVAGEEPVAVDDELGKKSLAALMSHPSLQALNAAQNDWRDQVTDLAPILAIGASQVHTDSPARDRDTRNHVPEAFRALMRSARREVLITNAYIIPDANFMGDLRELAERGVTLRILTNSLSSHDVPAVNSHYEQWRGQILESGAQLHELRSDAEVQSEIVDLPPLRAEFVGLHTKAMVIDRERVFVGSMNLDPRSEMLNSEMGVIIDSHALAEKLAERMERDMGGANSWQVVLAEDGSLRWRSTAGELTRQPARSFWQRVEDVIFKLFPANLY